MNQTQIQLINVIIRKRNLFDNKNNDKIIRRNDNNIFRRLDHVTYSTNYLY